MFSTLNEYHEMNAGAHRNSPRKLKSPALTWHIGFWTRTKEAKESGTPNTSDYLNECIDDLFIALIKEFKHRDMYKRAFPTVNNSIILFKSAYDRNDFSKINIDNIDKFSQKNKDILFSLNRAVSIDFSWRGLDVTIRCERHTEFVTLTTFIELDDSVSALASESTHIASLSSDSEFNDLAQCLRNILSGHEKNIIKIQKCRNYFFRSIWQSFNDELKNYSSIKGIALKFPFNNVFADFRGIILNEKVYNFSNISDPTSYANLNWGQKAKDTLLQIAKISKDNRIRNYECVVNYMLDGRVLYLSALAPQLPDTEDNDRIPVEYVIFVNRKMEGSDVLVNRRQLGRLIATLHLLGTVRIAAVKDIKRLHDVGRLLTHLDTVTQDARDTISNNTPVAMAKIEEAHRKLNEITSGFLQTGCGLSYRIERSRYYVKQFSKYCAFLRIKRLEGFQPYSQFIERRLGDEYDYINRLGIRYERAANTIVALDQNYLAMSAATTAKNTSNAEDRIHKIQEWGEFALIGALVPYYLTNLFQKMLVESVISGLAYATWTVCLSIAVSRIIYSNTKNIKSSLASGLVVIFLSLLIVFSFRINATTRALLKDSRHEHVENSAKTAKQAEQLPQTRSSGDAAPSGTASLSAEPANGNDLNGAEPKPLPPGSNAESPLKRQ